MDSLFYVLGFVICGFALLQMALWTSATVANYRHNREHLEASRKLMSQQIAATRQHKPDDNPSDGSWKGYREFHVAKLEPESDGVTSVYLKPVDGKPIVTFSAGQHLSLKFHVPGEPKPIVRCYSLSTGPREDFYRISVKAVAAPATQSNLPPGHVSNYINSQLMVGDTVEAKAPAGNFVLSWFGTSPIVLMAGGIGITPILSMLEELVASGTKRTIVLVYGVRCGREHAFKDRIAEIAKINRNVYVVNCYSNPDKKDRYGVDFQLRGRISIELIQRLMPNNQCNFYMCGPPEFMQSLQQGLQKWGVPENRIRFEAFGSATIRKTADTKSAGKVVANIEFARSAKAVAFGSQFESILEAAESHQVVMDSGCRAGSCKTCSIPLIQGNVRYPKGMDVECESGECLPCIAVPDGDVKIDA